MATLPSAAMVPDRNVNDEICPSPMARRLKMNRQPFAGAPDWSGCRTMLGLNKADASNEIFEHAGQLLLNGIGIKPENPIDDVVGPSLIGWIEVSGFSRRFEGSDDDPGRIWAQE